MTKLSLINIVGIVLVFTGILDAIKYSLQAFKIQKCKSAKAISRKFINFAITNDWVKITYAILIGDIYIFLTSLLALITMYHLFYTIYLFYPYKHYPKKLKNRKIQKRPNIFLYTWNSWLPNHCRPHL